MVRGRLVELNGTPLDTPRFEDARARRLAEREFNLSWTDTLPGGNRVVGGRFWAPGARGDADVWTFVHAGEEALALPEGSTSTVRLLRAPGRAYDTRGEDAVRDMGVEGFRTNEDIFSHFSDIFGDLFGPRFHPIGLR